MKHRRAKNPLTLHFSQRDFLPTITEGQPIDIGVVGPSLKLPFPRVYLSPNIDDWQIQADTSQHHPNNFKPTLEITRLGDVEEPPSPTSSLLSGKRPSSLVTWRRRTGAVFSHIRIRY